LNRARELLIAGADDNYAGARIYDNTMAMAGKMAQTPGRTLFLQRTGHSVHFERPLFLAGQIGTFFSTEAEVLDSLEYKIVSPVTGEALDVPGAAASNVQLQLWADNGQNNQRWKLNAVGNQLYKITSVSSGKVIDVRGASTTDGAAIQQYAD